MKKTITKICENSNCKKEFEVCDTKAGNKRKYCQKTCQIPWLKGKTNVYSPETIEKKRISSTLWYQSDEGKVFTQNVTMKRNLSEQNPWRNPKQEWIEKGQNSKAKTLKEHPEIRQSYDSMKGKHHSDETKEKISKSNLGRKCSLETRKKISEKCINDYKTGKRNILSGSDGPNWKGGWSKICDLIYSNTTFYKEWKFNILKRDNFKCVICDSSIKLHVHHNKEKLSDIYHNFIKNMNIDDISFNKKQEIVNMIVDYHITNNVSGVTLCYKCHKIEHPSLNFK